MAPVVVGGLAEERGAVVWAGARAVAAEAANVTVKTSDGPRASPHDQEKGHPGAPECYTASTPPTAMASDADIIHAVVQGDVDRYAQLVEKYQGPAFRLALGLVGHVEDAKDISQEAFVNAYRALGRFRGGAKFSTWLYRIVVNECKDTYRQRARHPVAAAVGGSDPGSDDGTLFVDVEDPTADPRGHAANRELSRRISETIHALPMKQRTAFVLHHLHGLTLDEAAAVMECRVGTVKSHVFRATEQLRRHLRPWLAEEVR